MKMKDVGELMELSAKASVLRARILALKSLQEMLPKNLIVRESLINIGMLRLPAYSGAGCEWLHCEIALACADGIAGRLAAVEKELEEM